MSEHYYLEDCNPEDIFSFDGEAALKANLIKEAIQEAVNQELPRVIENALKAKNININLPKTEEKNVLQWLGQLVENRPEIGEILLKQGIPCRLLKPQQNWRTGKLKLKLSLEFVPDQNPSKNWQSSLDDLH
ncbi:KGK domain-containing protein [Gloeocapsa sp. PCC 73106]|uniref:KGK domain-containing protein n=1 Tax=Gloeocapsa sp. PCC 73106 TaxID=102232 RepID=UPI0002AD0DF3|nr:KGK domain-containing protein [Gloeocapsa sp. PCC 73106]ELR96449.1 KGK domain protein [Gloeocapsa sp. PCC 73106]